MSNASAIKPSRVFITGGAGFIGSRLAASFADSAEVTVYDNLHPQVHEGCPGNLARVKACDAKLIEADIRDAAALGAALEAADPDVVYHLAAETGTGQSFDEPGRYTEINVMGTTHLIEAMRRLPARPRRVVLAGSRSVYGEGAHRTEAGHLVVAPARDEAAMAAGDFAPRAADGGKLVPVATQADCPVAPASVYASTKLMQEYLLEQAFWGSDTQVGILRLQNVYGAGQSINNPYTGVLSIFARQVLEGKTLNIFEDGEIVRDFVHVDDVVRAFHAMGVVGQVPGRIVDIGAGEATTIREVAEKMLTLLGADAGNYRVTGAFRPGDIRYAVADTSAAREDLGWAPERSLDDGLAELAEWSRGEFAAVG
ncbi:NAD-dependent epimerase/dehydratase family protein [Pseudaestuariivita atlantica]|uniref:Epimerase n=1 Tax=Pseudaestuariivita atlantica TaxID=1317121 RepID=A0A0L1JKG9_9RHOB|nr:NAD-dependent epimerase/dehydratase family protein [Pseudaestuariivita atlantica]KNG92246.1 epimerase [Pseudaestuariivita atlantica]